MDGKQQLYQLRNMLQEGATSSFLDTRTSFDYIYQAACQFVMDTRLLTAFAQMRTSANTYKYDLPADFMSLFLMDQNNEHAIKYLDRQITYRSYSAMWLDARDEPPGIPDNFAIIDGDTAPLITGVSPSNGAVVTGCSVLEGGDFSEVSIGDLIHNTTDGSDGVVVGISPAEIHTALFNGINNKWSAGDDYIITLQPKKQIVFNRLQEPGDVFEIPYIQKPNPVYTDYGTYRFPSIYVPAVLSYAAWLYKYRDREPSFGDAWYKHWEMQVRKAKANEDTRPDRHKWRVNFKKRSYGYRSMR